MRWLDAEGRVIDGFCANEKLDKKAAKQVVRVSVPTLKYAVERAETLEVTVHFKLAGIYGMNFNAEASPWNMPELDWYWAYPAFWLLMIGVGGGLVFYFRRKGWL